MANVCVINSLYRPFLRGGAETTVERIVNGCLAAGHTVSVITLGNSEALARDGRLAIYRIVPLNIFSFLVINQRAIWLRIFWHPLDVFNISGALKVRKILREVQPDVVMTHNLKGLGYLIPRVIRQLGIQHIHTLHDVQLSRPSGLILFGHEKPFLILDKIYEKICRRLFANPDIVISPSKWLLDYYKVRGFFYQSKKIVLPNPVELIGPPPVEQPDRRGVVTLLYVGQLERYKGIFLLLEALKNVDYRNWQLIIVGNGGSTDEVARITKGDERFQLVGRVDPVEMPQWYRRADLTIVPSLCYENSPSVIPESLVANVPVIAADIGGAGEIITDNVNGFTFAPGSVKSLTEVLNHFLARPETLSELKKHAFTSVREHSLNKYIASLEQMFSR